MPAVPFIKSWTKLFAPAQCISRNPLAQRSYIRGHSGALPIRRERAYPLHSRDLDL
jgi:hypothetical protein